MTITSDRIAALSERAHIRHWIDRHGVKTETGKPLDFVTHRYLADVYADSAKKLVCLKSAQIGFSTMAILKTMWLALMFKMDVAYILPTYEMVQKFVGSKVNRMAQQCPYLSSLMKDKDSITQKQIGQSFIHYLGAQTETSAIMLSLDMLVADEYDKSPQNILETYDSRLQHSDKGYKWVFSNPTSPDFGVDRFWRMSDKKIWHVTHSCGQQFPFDESCIDYDARMFRCPKCKGEITTEERHMGEWVATAKGEWSGYWIPLWISPLKTAEDICEYKRTKSAEYFYNFVAGLPYAGSGNKVSAQTIEKCLKSEVNDQDGRIIIGVDTGLPIHYVLANKSGYFHYGKCSDPLTGKDPYDELEALLKRFPNSILISDQGGDLIGIRKLQAKYPGRVFLVWYRTDRKTLQVIQWGEGDEYGKVIADRNRLIQMFIDEMLDKRVVFNGNESDWHDYIVHWLNIHREWEYDDSGQVDKGKGFVWSRTGPDHWVHATCYARIGLDKFSSTMAKVISDVDLFDGISNAKFF